MQITQEEAARMMEEDPSAVVIDVRTQAEYEEEHIPGAICIPNEILYQGNQIVIFYGSNSWSYTRLGKVTGRDASRMEELLGSGDVTFTISLD